MIRHIKTRENIGLALVNFQTAAIYVQVLKTYGTFTIADYHATLAEVPAEARQGVGIAVTPTTWEDGVLTVPEEIELGALPIGELYPGVAFYIDGASDAQRMLLCSQVSGAGFPLDPQNGRNVLLVPDGILYRI